MTRPAQDDNDRYPGLPPELVDALRQAAADGRDLWLEVRLSLDGQDGESDAVVDERVGGTVFLRHADPAGPPEDPRPARRPGRHDHPHRSRQHDATAEVPAASTT